MAFEDTDRRRTVLLVVVTLLALPALYLLNRSETDDGSAAATVAEGTAAVAHDAPNRPPIEAPDDAPVFMEGPARRSEPGIAEVAVPARPERPPIQMDASYRRGIGDRTCLVRDVGAGATVAVRNLDNGRTVECTAAAAPEDQIVGIVLARSSFSLLADLTEAPIPVDVVERS